MEKIAVPPIKIQGIKTKIVPLIKENAKFDPDTVWVEPFMGSGVVGFNAAPRRAVFADANPHLIDFYCGIQNGEITPSVTREFLEREGKLLEEGDEKHYYAVRERFNRSHRPLDFLFLNRSCFNGMIRFNKNREFNVPYGHKPARFSKAYITKIVNQVAWVEEAIRRNDWRFLCRSFEETISTAPRDAFIYCDPPYVGRHVDYYDSWDETRENALKSLLVEQKRRFMTSTWDYNQYRKNECVETIWGFCKKIDKAHFYHVGAKEANRAPMMEALLINY